MLKILVLHNNYREKGGEDSVVDVELAFLQNEYEVEKITFQNTSGVYGLFQFIVSIWNLSSARKLTKHINKFRPDVIHIHNWHFASGPIVFRVAKKFNIPVVHTLHNFRLLCPSATLFYNGRVFKDSLNQSFAWKAIRNKVFRKSMSLTFWLAFVVWFHKKIGTWKMIDRYVCLTSFSKSIFIESSLGINAEHFCIKPNFMAKDDSFVSNSPQDGAYLFVGRLTHEKGILTLLDAFAISRLNLIIAGDGLLRGNVEQYCKSYNNIKYLGQLDKISLLNVMRQSKALIFPSIWYEGMPMTIIESLSLGLPVIASKLGAMESMIVDGRNGLLFNPGNVENLLEAISKFEALDFYHRAKMSKVAKSSFDQNYSEAQQSDYFRMLYTFEKN